MKRLEPVNMTKEVVVWITGLKLKLCLFLLFPAFGMQAQQSTADRIASLVKHYSDENLFNGSVLVAENGNVIYKAGVGLANMEWNVPNTTQTKFRMGSITKQFTSMLIMQMVKQGKIQLDAPITRYLTNYRKETGDSITIHHLLSHSSGLPNYTDNDNFFRGDSKKEFATLDFIRIYCSGDPEFKPGSRFAYSNSGYFILGAIIEAVTKKPYHTVLQEQILDVVGMKNTGYDFFEEIISNRAAGYEHNLDGYTNAAYLDMSLPYAAGSLYSTVEDLFLWNKALYTQKLLPDSLKKKMFTGYADAGGDKAGYGWFVRHFPSKDSTRQIEMIWHNGGINGFLSELARFPKDENFVAILDNTGGNTSGLIIDIINILYDLPSPERKKDFANAIRQNYRDGSMNAALQFYNTLSKEDKEKYDFRGAERQINRWGYYLLNNKKKPEDAVKMFEINVKQFPQSSNVYDSYGEALMVSGQTARAIENYKKAYAMDSTNRRAKSILTAMQVKTDTLKVVVDGHEMIMYKTGNKGPVVVLEAGGNSDHNSWNMILPELSKDHIVITYDRPGYLYSVSCSKPRTANRVAEELYEALTKSGIKGPYVIGGWSWGGFFARAFAASYPLSTSGVLLVDPAQREAYMQMAVQQPDDYTKSFRERTAVNHAAEDEFAAMLASMQQADLSDIRYNGKIELLIAGSFEGWGDSEKPSKQIWIDELVKWAKERNHTRYEIVDSGHNIQSESPGTVIAAIRRLAQTENDK